MAEFEEPTKSGISRRTVAKAMAWSVPAIAIAAPAPAFASSDLVTISPGVGCKAPGQGQNCAAWDKGYILSFVVNNEHDHAITLTFSDLVVTPQEPGTTWTFFNSTVTVAAESSETVYVGIDDQGTSEQSSFSGTAVASYTDPVTQKTYTIPVTFSVASVNPCGTGGAPPGIPKCPPVG